jgi:hypothetical protein
MKTLIALLVLTAPAVHATTVACSVQEIPTDSTGSACVMLVAAAKTEKTGKTAAPAPTPPSTPPPKQPQRREPAPKPAPPAHLFM